MKQHKGDLIVTEETEIEGQVKGTTYVRPGGKLKVLGQLSGGLIIEEGGEAVVLGQVSRNVLNHGKLTLFGQVSGRVLGNQPVNILEKNQIAGIDLEVPFRG